MLDIFIIIGAFCAISLTCLIVLYAYVVYTSPFVEHSFIDFVKVFFECLFKKPSEEKEE